MLIKIWASVDSSFPNQGPYKLLDTIKKDALYSVGEMTHYGEVILIPPPMLPFSDEVDQSVVVKLNPGSLSTLPDESVTPKPPKSYNKIEFFPILVDKYGYLSNDPPLTGAYTILAAENLTVEDVSSLLTEETFSLWKQDCYVSKDTADALENVTYAIVHRYSSPTDRDSELDLHSTDLINSAVACLALIRPTRRSRAMNIPGVIRSDGTFDPHGFSAAHEPAEVPEIQKLFTIRKKDIDLLTVVLPEFLKLYQKDGQGRLIDEYEPLRMAIQLYGEAYAISYWKARHILWWAAIEALFGNPETSAMARIYALFGNHDLVKGFHRSIYDDGDIPSCYPASSYSDHKLGKMVPLIYDVRNFAAHGQKVPDSHFSPVAHPFGTTVVGVDALAEAVTFIIRKTVIAILQYGFREKFKDRDARDDFWVYEYGLDKKRSKKKLQALKDSLGLPRPRQP
jgi:hypothetical protein